MKVMLDPGAYAPKRAHKTDAGMDIMSRETMMVPAHCSATFSTGVHIELPKGTAGVLKSKSGLHILNDITSDGLIDEGYSGEIKVKLTNHGDRDYWVMSGDKISQLLVVPVLYEPIEVVKDIAAGERGEAGFGSTGR